MMPKARRGFLAVDMVIGLTMLGTLTVAMAYAAHGYARADLRLTQQRAAARAAEQALAAVQAGESAEAVAKESLGRFGAEVTLVELKEDLPGSVAGRKWYAATARVKGRTVELVGMGGAR